MVPIICVFGIVQELRSRESLLAEWSPSLCGGPTQVDTSNRLIIDMHFMDCCSGHRVAKGGETQIAIPNYKPSDVKDALEV